MGTNENNFVNLILFVDCLMACKKTVWKIVDVARQRIHWKTNWTSEFFLEAETANVQVLEKVNLA